MTRLNLPMIKRQILRLAARKYVSMETLAKRTITLCPEETASLPPAIYLEGALERITALSPWRNRQQEDRLIFGGKAVLPPSLAYQIEDVDVVGAWLYAGAAKDNPGFGAERWLSRNPGRRQEIAKANLVTTVGGSHFFGALLLDDFVIELNAADPENNIRMSTKSYGHESDYRNLLGLADSPLISHARIGLLTTFAEPSNNSFRAARYRILRERLRHNFRQSNTAAAPIGVYLKRGVSGEQRLLDNEPEIEVFLAGLGFDIVEPAALTVNEIIGRTMNAPVVVTVEGSHMSHTQYTMADNAAYVVLEPPDRFSTVYKEFADCLGMKFAFLVGEKTAQGFSISIEELRRILDRVI